MKDLKRAEKMAEPKTNWIWSSEWVHADKKSTRLVYFRKEIFTESDADEACVRISADTRYKLYVNGKLAEAGPSKGDREVWFADTVDIRPYLKRGVNTLAVIVLRYPMERENGNHGMFRSEIPGFYLTGAIHFAGGNKLNIAADESWLSYIDRDTLFLREEKDFSPLFIHEETWGNPDIFGWMKPGYANQKWKAAVRYGRDMIDEAVAPGNLNPRTIPFMYRKPRHFQGIIGTAENGANQNQETAKEKAGWNQETAKEKADRNQEDLKKTDRGQETKNEANRNQENPENGDWERLLSDSGILAVPANSCVRAVVNAGEEMTGYLHLAFSGGKNADVRLLESEAYVQDEHSATSGTAIKKDRMDFVNGHLEGYTDIYHVSGIGTEDEPEEFTPFWFRTFRFIEVTIQTREEPLAVRAFDYEETGYPLESGTSVETSDPSLKAIWEISERTLRRCMHETYEDCPFYEQLQYVMDTRAQILYTYALAADDRLARKAIDDFSRAQRSNGLLNCSYPNMNPNVIPGFSIFYILMIHDHMMYFGDKVLVRRYLPTVDKILNYFDRHRTDQGLVEKIGGVLHEARYWSFVDWAKEWNRTQGMPPAGLKGPLTMENLLYIYGLQKAAELSEYVGRMDTAEEYRARAAAVQKAVRNFCMRDDGMIADGPESRDASQHGQVFGILTGTLNRDAGRRNLLRTLSEPGFPQCTVAMQFYLFRALEETGLYSCTDRSWDIWRAMTREKCTTCVESEDYARSECHAWGALALYELPAAILGVRPIEPGYRKAAIRPHTEFLTSASGNVRTPKGVISLSWEKEAGKVCVSAQVPRGMETVCNDTDNRYYLCTV